MSDKKSCDISSAVLYIATALYCLLLSVSMCVLISTRPETATLLESFANFVKDYSSAIAGIPVLLGILVAREQLIASRRQHHNLMSFNLMPHYQTFSEVMARAKVIIADIQDEFPNDIKLDPTKKKVLRGWSIHLSPFIDDMIQAMEKNYFEAEKLNATQSDPIEAERCYDLARDAAEKIIQSVAARQAAVTQITS
ncbi:hypothetical protein [Ochrobactrum soli]|uniref:hypothetical protein n=1 Tax=Ochrobactrum soli TaxID=2448455 RepID=UPI0011C445DA|nr:hypothetical protein [[Ochrobactrum] soli]